MTKARVLLCHRRVKIKTSKGLDDNDFEIVWELASPPEVRLSFPSPHCLVLELTHVPA